MSHRAETEDYVAFGADAWVYCAQHLRPHTTGWCTVSTRQKVLLDAKTDKDAYQECIDKDFPIYNSTPFTTPQKPFYPSTKGR